LDRPLKVGGGIQPQLVTVLTPATTFTVGLNCNQNRRVVKRGVKLFYGKPASEALTPSEGRTSQNEKATKSVAVVFI